MPEPVNKGLGVSRILTQSLYERLVSEAIRRVQHMHSASDQDIADVIGCSAATIGNARNQKGSLSAATLFNLLTVDPMALEGFLHHFGRRTVVIEAKCDTDALPTTSLAVHKLAVVTADTSAGGRSITDNEALECEAEIDAAIEALASLKARCIAIRARRAA